MFISAQTAMFRDGVCQNLSFQNVFGGNFCTENLVFVYIFQYTRSNVYFVDKFCYKMGLNDV